MIEDWGVGLGWGRVTRHAGLSGVGLNGVKSS
jgi:hypothetical protein